VKRRDLIRHLEEHGCRLLREGANHTIYFNPSSRKASTVPRPQRRQQRSRTKEHWNLLTGLTPDYLSYAS
jgi:predicted RNA binding protein YcfA (HicA-like mRNA interferase family)